MKIPKESFQIQNHKCDWLPVDEDQLATMLTSTNVEEMQEKFKKLYDLQPTLQRMLANFGSGDMSSMRFALENVFKAFLVEKALCFCARYDPNEVAKEYHASVKEIQESLWELIKKLRRSIADETYVRFGWFTCTEDHELE